MPDREFIKSLIEGAKCDCPHCGRWAQVYKRSIRETIAVQLIRLYRLGGDTEFIHGSKLIPHGQTSMSDMTKAKYFGLIVAMPHEEGRIKSTGFWKLTQDGIDYVRGFLSIPEYCIVFDDRIIEFSHNKVFITDAIGLKFDYQELMSGPI